MKGAMALLAILIMIILCSTLGLVVAHMPEDGRPPPEYPDFDPEGRIGFHPSMERPGFSMEGEDRVFPFIMEPIEITFQKGNESDTNFPPREPWNVHFDPSNRSISYRSIIIQNGFGPFNISLDITPSNDGTRRIYYNLSLAGDIDLDRVLIRWRFGLPPPPEEQRFKDDTRWKENRDNLVLNDTKGRPLMNVNMYKHARIKDPSGISTEEIVIESGTSDDNGTINAAINISGNVEQVETSGYLEILENFLEFIEDGAGETARFIREHWISFSIGIVSMVIITGTAVGSLKRKSSNVEAYKDLDYRSSRYFKGPRVR